MTYKTVVYCLLSLILMMGGNAYTKSPDHSDLADSEALLRSSGLPDSLVTVDWLKEHLDDPDLIVLDTTVQIDFDQNGELIISSGRSAYGNGHIPTAGFADLTSDLIDTSSQYAYAVPTPEKFAAAMAMLGVSDDSYVVLYASDYSAWAARVWWMLKWIGFDNAAVLDGGLAAWTAAGYPLSTESVSNEPAALSISLRPELIADRDEVFDAISDNSVMLIDAMPAAHFAGEMQMYDRTGHIPSAINIPAVFSDDGYFLSKEALAESHPPDRNTRVITYCGGGISASANAFAMHRLGFSDVAVYMNSLQEWAANSENPLSTTVE